MITAKELLNNFIQDEIYDTVFLKGIDLDSYKSEFYQFTEWIINNFEPSDDGVVLAMHFCTELHKYLIKKDDTNIYFLYSKYINDSDLDKAHSQAKRIKDKEAVKLYQMFKEIPYNIRLKLQDKNFYVS